MKWRKQNKVAHLHVYYECQKTKGNVSIQLDNFKWTREAFRKMSEFISHEYCNKRPVLIMNVIHLKDEP